ARISLSVTRLESPRGLESCHRTTELPPRGPFAFGPAADCSAPHHLGEQLRESIAPLFSVSLGQELAGERTAPPAPLNPPPDRKRCSARLPTTAPGEHRQNPVQARHPSPVGVRRVAAQAHVSIAHDADI